VLPGSELLGAPNLIRASIQSMNWCLVFFVHTPKVGEIETVALIRIAASVIACGPARIIASGRGSLSPAMVSDRECGEHVLAADEARLLLRADEDGHHRSETRL
jgi:hypothetical protein